MCIAGDGGMQMAGMEALVALRERLPILFVVFNDGRYNMVHHGMRQIFGAASQYDMPPVDFAAWARSFGMPAARSCATRRAHGGARRATCWRTAVRR